MVHRANSDCDLLWILPRSEPLTTAEPRTSTTTRKKSSIKTSPLPRMTNSPIYAKKQPRFVHGGFIRPYPQRCTAFTRTLAPGCRTRVNRSVQIERSSPRIRHRPRLESSLQTNKGVRSRYGSLNYVFFMYFYIG